MPYQPGSMTRDWDQERTQGMARRSEMAVVCLRDAGRDPMLRSPISARGVEEVKYSMKPGSLWTRSAYLVWLSSEISRMMA